MKDMRTHSSTVQIIQPGMTGLMRDIENRALSVCPNWHYALNTVLFMGKKYMQ